MKMDDTSSFLPPAIDTQRFQFLSVEALLARAPIKWRVKGILPEAGIAAIFGPSGSGKSFLALDLAMALSEGREWFGYRVASSPVFYCALEGEAGMVNRLKGLMEKHPNNGKQLYFLTEPIDIRNPNDVEALATAMAILMTGVRGGVVIIDTLNRAAPGADENSPKDMSQIISSAGRLQTMTGCLVILIHHTGKDEAKGLRGHSSLHAAQDVAIEVKRIGKSDQRSWQVIKSKDGSEGNPHPFTQEMVKIGVDEYGEDITSCVVTPSTVKGEVTTHKQNPIPTSKHQRVTLMALQEELSKPKAEHNAPPPSFVPTNRTAICFEEAVRLTKDQLDCEDKRKTERAKDAIRGLVNHSWLVEQDGWLWLS